MLPRRGADRRQLVDRRLGHFCLMAGRPWQWPADSTLPLKAAPAVPFWWTHGEIEAGGRDFLNDPTVGGSVSADTNRANFATGGYATVEPAKFGEVLRVQHRGAGRVRRRPCRHRHQ